MEVFPWLHLVKPCLVKKGGLCNPLGCCRSPLILFSGICTGTASLDHHTSRTTDLGKHTLWYR